MTKDNFEMPDYYNTSKPKIEEELVKRKCKWLQSWLLIKKGVFMFLNWFMEKLAEWLNKSK